MRGRLFFIGLIALLVPLVVAACGESDPPRDEETGEIVEEGGVSVFRIRAGDCLLQPDEDAEEIGSLDAVPCDQPHDAEAFALFDMEGAADAPYPGMAAVDGAVVAGCTGSRFDAYVGIAYVESRYFAAGIFPTEETWEERDDREIVCIAVDPLGQITGSIRGRAE